jgi:Zn-dependent alcohol dehydrogenase
MKAPVLFEQRAPLRVEELQVEPPRAGEVVARMVAGGVYLAGTLRLGALITRRCSIDEANQAFRDLAAGALARGLIVF